MDSKNVSQEIHRQVWPALKEAGFDQFVGRTAWRHSGQKIDVVNFQSFNSYLAARVGCTTFSFSVNLGCFLLSVPGPYGKAIAAKNGLLAPQEFECHLRRRLAKTLRQPELGRKDTWFVGMRGEYLVESAADALHQIKQEGLPWFERFADQGEVVRTLAQDNEDETFGFGARGSPQRHMLLGYVELSCKNRQAAHQHLRVALEKLSKAGFQSGLETQLRNTLRELEGERT